MSLLDAETKVFSTPLPEWATAQLLPESIRDCVTVAPPPRWVKIREYDPQYAPVNPGPGAVLLLDHQARAAERQFYKREVTRLETMDAAQQARQWRYDRFNPSTERLVLHSVSVWRGGKVFEHAHVAKLHLLQCDANYESHSVEDTFTIVVLVGDTRVGDVIDVSFTLQPMPKWLPDLFWMSVTLPRSHPVADFRVTAQFRSDAGMRWKGTPDLGPLTTKTLAGETEWSWRRSRIPPREPESDVPRRKASHSGIEISNCVSWAQVAAGAYSAWSECFDDAEVTKCAAEISAACGSKAERVNRAITFVQDELRGLRLSIELDGQVPASPGRVLQRRVGDSKDKAFLLAHLLRLLGASARPVLVNSSSGDMVAKRLPSPAAFDHVIVEYDLDGQRRWVDPTIAFQGGDALSRRLPDYRLGLPLGPDVTELEKISPSPSIDFYELRESFRLDTTGRPPFLQVTIHAGGRDADLLRHDLRTFGTEALSRQCEQLYKRIFLGLRRIFPLDWADDRQLNEIRLREAYELPGAIVPAKDKRRCTFRYHSHILQNLLSVPVAAKRLKPFALPPFKRVDHWVEFESPALGRGEPSIVQVRDAAFRFSHETKKFFGRWSTHFTLRFVQEEISAENFGRYKAKVDEILPAIAFEVSLPEGVACRQVVRRDRNPSIKPAGQPPEHRDGRNLERPAPNWEEGGAAVAQLPTLAPPLRSRGPDSKPAACSKPAPRNFDRRPTASDRTDDPHSTPQSEKEPQPTGLRIDSEVLPPGEPPPDGFSAGDQADQPNGRARRRSRTRRNRRRRGSRVIMVLLALFGLLTLAIWLHVLARKEPVRPDPPPAETAEAPVERQNQRSPIPAPETRGNSRPDSKVTGSPSENQTR